MDVLTRSCESDLLILVVKNLTDLGRVARRANHYLVTNGDKTLLNLAVGNDTLLLNTFENGHSKGTLGISVLNWEFIKDLHKCITFVPRADRRVNHFCDVGASKTGNRNVTNVFRGVS